MGLICEPDRFPFPLFPFSLGVLGTRRVGDQTKSSHTQCVLASRQVQAGRGISTVTLRFRASDGSSVDMKSGLRELTALSLLAAFCWWSYEGSR